MSIAPAIRVEGLGKQYKIGKAPSYKSFRETFQTAFTRAFSRSVSRKSPIDQFWALNDINFEISPGSVVGIIGSNGAGKSTLLKILSRITKPTLGKFEIRGRLGSLLEVGTGFHPELTGRENIFLSGAILGMRRLEIKEAFDEIVSFAEVEKFLDTPVKHYSSGMYMRLAFAVAAHLRCEILLVDEVLAVGDSRFQKKCFTKMNDVSRNGRTILFVSHSMPSITRLCREAIYLQNGCVVDSGPTSKVIGSYLRSGERAVNNRSWEEITTAPGNEIVRLRSVIVKSETKEAHISFDVSESFQIQVVFDVLQSHWVLLPAVTLTNQDGIVVFQTHDWDPKPRAAGRYHCIIQIPAHLMSEGTYYVTVGIGTPSPMQRHLREKDAILFEVVDRKDVFGIRELWAGDLIGIVRPHLPWKTVIE